MAKKFTKIAMQQIKYVRNQVAEHGPRHRRYRSSETAKYERLIRELGELLLYLKRHDGGARSATVGRSHSRQQGESVGSRARNGARSQSLELTMQQGDRYNLSDLPAELLEELSEEASRDVGHQLIEIIDGRGGTATLDEILIDLYRKYKKVGKRANVAKRLLFLSRRGLCRLVPGANGYYTTTKPD